VFALEPRELPLGVLRPREEEVDFLVDAKEDPASRPDGKPEQGSDGDLEEVQLVKKQLPRRRADVRSRIRAHHPGHARHEGPERCAAHDTPEIPRHPSSHCSGRPLAPVAKVHVVVSTPVMDAGELAGTHFMLILSVAAKVAVWARSVQLVAVVPVIWQVIAVSAAFFSRVNVYDLPRPGAAPIVTVRYSAVPATCAVACPFVLVVVHDPPVMIVPYVVLVLLGLPPVRVPVKA